MPNNVNYFEIGTTDPEAAKAFYGATFGWTFGEPGPAGYASVGVRRPLAARIAPVDLR